MKLAILSGLAAILAIIIWIFFPTNSLPTVIGHRGASGVYPEHTKIAYEKAAEMGADYIECDLQLTKDLKLVCSHEAWIKEVSNVGRKMMFKDRLAEEHVFDDDDPEFDWNDRGKIVDNYFTFDFTLKELQTLRRKQTYPERNPNFNWIYTFVSFDEFVEIANAKRVGIAMELKSPSAINKILKNRAINTTFEEIVLDSLTGHGFTSAEDKCIIQCFELSILERMKNLTNLHRMFLLQRAEKTDDSTLKRIKNAGISSICLDKDLLVSGASTGYIERENKELIERIHELEMLVFAYTFKNELFSLKWDYQGHVFSELQKFYDLGIDGYHSDFPYTVRSFLDSL